MAKFDSKSFNPQAFGAYVERIPNVKKTELASSMAIGENENAKHALSSQTGSLYCRIPYSDRIDGSTSQNNDGNTDITSSGTSSYEQGLVVASRMDSWTERSFSRNITAGVDFMDAVAQQIGDYKQQVKQNILLSILRGVFSMNTESGGFKSEAAKEFIEKHTFDITENDGSEAYVRGDTLNKAIQKACGDNKSAFSLVIMHSEVATNLENLQLLKYLTHTDKEGITRDLAMGSWNGRTVLVDDSMPIQESDGETVYTTYILGKESIVLDNIGDYVPYEMSRDARTNGGEDTLYVRDRYICGVDGISFEKPDSLTGSASNEDLANGENWCIINDGVKTIPHKSIAIARIISKG